MTEADIAGYEVFAEDPDVKAWAAAAHRHACLITADPDQRAANLRHGATWFVGVDALSNEPDGSIGGVPLCGPWGDRVAAPARWHRAQLSVVYPGYPRQDPQESDANHRYRIARAAAHVDGLLPVGPTRRRYLREPHAFILGLPLSRSAAAPLVVWPGSHSVMHAAFRAEIADNDPTAVDLTDIYHATRRTVFDTITPRRLPLAPGQAVLLHRHLLHGVAPWAPGDTAPPEGRMTAYFRPQLEHAVDWLRAP